VLDQARLTKSHILSPPSADNNYTRFLSGPKSTKPNSRNLRGNRFSIFYIIEIMEGNTIY
jgi:hypothetical protein